MTAEEFLNEWYYDFDCIIEQDNQYTGEYQQDYAAEVMEAYAEQKQLDLINDIKQKVMKLEETTTITDFPFDVIHLLKSIEPIKK